MLLTGLSNHRSRLSGFRRGPWAVQVQVQRFRREPEARKLPKPKPRWRLAFAISASLMCNGGQGPIRKVQHCGLSRTEWSLNN